MAVNGDGTLSYTPVADYNGLDSFTYRVSDPGGLLDEATVTITIAADGVVAGNDVAVTDEDAAIVISVATLLLNDSSSNSGAVLSVDAVATISSRARQ